MVVVAFMGIETVAFPFEGFQIFGIFNTAVGVTTVSDKNTISACVYGAQSVTDGQAVKLRLLEPMAVADKIIPRNAVVVGTAKIINSSTRIV